MVTSDHWEAQRARSSALGRPTMLKRLPEWYVASTVRCQWARRAGTLRTIVGLKLYLQNPKIVIQTINYLILKLESGKMSNPTQSGGKVEARVAQKKVGRPNTEVQSAHVPSWRPFPIAQVVTQHRETIVNLSSLMEWYV